MLLNGKNWLVAGALLGFLFIGAGSLDAGIVYIGLDPGNGHSQPESGPLIANATRFAGGEADPVIGYLEASGGFGSGTLGPKLAAEGFTSTTLLTSAFIAGATVADLLAYEVLYFGPTTDSTDIANYIAGSAAIAGYVAAGGGLVVEPEVFDAGSWTWVPDAALIGHSGATNVGDESVTIVDPGHPVMAGLTSAGLSGWGFSIHTDFDPIGAAAAGYDILAVGPGGRAAIIARGTQTVIPEPTSFALLGMGIAGLAGARMRRRRHVQ